MDHFGIGAAMKDATGKEHYTCDFFLDPSEWEDRRAPTE